MYAGLNNAAIQRTKDCLPKFGSSLFFVVLKVNDSAPAIFTEYSEILVILVKTQSSIFIMKRSTALNRIDEGQHIGKGGKASSPAAVGASCRK